MKNTKYVFILCLLLLIVLPIVGTMMSNHNEKLIEPLSETTKWQNLNKFGKSMPLCSETNTTECCDISNPDKQKYCGVGNLLDATETLKSQEKLFERKLKNFANKIKNEFVPKSVSSGNFRKSVTGNIKQKASESEN